MRLIFFLLAILATTAVNAAPIAPLSKPTVAVSVGCSVKKVMQTRWRSPNRPRHRRLSPSYGKRFATRVY